MTDEKLQTLNAMKEKIDELEEIITNLECADCPAIMNCDWDTGNYDRRVQKFEEA